MSPNDQMMHRRRQATREELEEGNRRCWRPIAACSNRPETGAPYQGLALKNDLGADVDRHLGKPGEGGPHSGRQPWEVGRPRWLLPNSSALQPSTPHEGRLCRPRSSSSDFRRGSRTLHDGSFFAPKLPWSSCHSPQPSMRACFCTKKSRSLTKAEALEATPAPARCLFTGSPHCFPQSS